MKVTPLHNNVLLRRTQSEKKTGLIHIPDTASEKSQQGEVLAVGPGKTTLTGELIPMQVSSGDVVLFEKHRSADIKLDGETYVLVKEDDIILVFEKVIVDNQ